MSKNGRFSSVSRTVGIDRSKKIARKTDYLDLDHLDLDRTYTLEEFEIISNQLKTRSSKIEGKIINHFELDKLGKLVPIPSVQITRETDYLDLDHLDLDRTYTLKEFEIINDQLKNHSLEIEIEGKIVPISHFELDKSNKLVPMPQTPIFKETAVAEIVGQLHRWNIQTGQNGNVTSSQGGFRIETGEIRAPDVAFTPKEIYRSLTKVQGTSFRGPAFSPTLVVEVDDMEDTNSAKFHKLDSKFKDTYFALGTSVKLGWLIDPINDQIWVYKRTNINNGCHRYKYRWKDLDGGDTLPGFKLKVWKIKEAMSQEPSESSEDENLHHFCPYCSQTFNNGHLLIEHMEDDHLRKKRKKTD